MTDQQQFKRVPAVYRTVATIQPEHDVRIRLLGRVIGAGDGMIVIDDGTGRADIVADGCEAAANDIVRVFARVLPLEHGVELHAELVQPMGTIDPGRYHTVFGDRYAQ